MRVLITGATGFVGSHLARRYAREGHDVHIVARASSDTARIADLGAGVTLHRLSLADDAALRSCLARARPTHIFHLAGDTPARHDPGLGQARRSVDALADLLALVTAAAAAELPPTFFLRAGSIAEYGDTAVPFREDQRERPRSGYAATIVAGTHYAQMLAPGLPFPLVTARLALVYGPGQAEDFLIPSLIAACRTGRPLVLERPLDRRDLVHVDDVVAALVRLADARLAGGEVVNIGSGKSVAIAEIANLVAGLAGVDAGLFRSKPPHDPAILQLSIDRIAALIGWRPRIALAEGLAGLVADRGRVAVAVAA